MPQRRASSTMHRPSESLSNVSPRSSRCRSREAAASARWSRRYRMEQKHPRPQGMTLLTEFSQLVQYRAKRGKARRNRLRNQSLPPAPTQERRSLKERFQETTLSKNIDYLQKLQKQQRPRKLQRSSSEGDLQGIQNALKEQIMEEEDSRFVAKKFQESPLATSMFARNVDYLQNAMTRKSEALSRSVHGSMANYHNRGDEDGNDFVPYEESLVGRLQGIFQRPESPLDYEASLSDSSSSSDEEEESVLSRNMAYLGRRVQDTVARKKGAADKEEGKAVPQEEQEQEPQAENTEANPQEEPCNPQDVSSVPAMVAVEPKKETPHKDTQEAIATKEKKDSIATTKEKGSFAKNVDYLQAKADTLTKSMASLFGGKAA